MNFENILDYDNPSFRNIYFVKYFNKDSNDGKTDENKNKKNKRKNRKKEYNNIITNIIFNSNLEEYNFSQLKSNNKILINNSFINNSINVINYNFYSKYFKNNSNNYYFVNNVFNFENKIINFQ